MDYETADGSQFSLREIWSEDPNPTNTTTATTTHTTKPINSPKFEHTLITAFVDGNAYAGKSLQRISAMDDVDVFGYLEPVPSENIFPIMPAEFTRAPPFDMANHYLKAPQFTYEDSRPGRTSVADRLRNEARVLEFLMGQGRRRRRMENGDGNDVVGGKDEVGGDEVDAAAAAVPHPNVVRYYGCVLKDERITHLCLQRCYCNLAEYAEVGLSSEETDELLGQVQEGLKFLHGLGLAHNDIHPGNICVDSHGNAIIVDFDSCAPFGQPLTKGVACMTSTTTEKGVPVSDKKNDYEAFKELVQFLKKERKRSSACYPQF